MGDPESEMSTHLKGDIFQALCINLIGSYNKPNRAFNSRDITLICLNGFSR